MHRYENEIDAIRIKLYEETKDLTNQTSHWAISLKRAMFYIAWANLLIQVKKAFYNCRLRAMPGFDDSDKGFANPGSKRLPSFKFFRGCCQNHYKVTCQVKKELSHEQP